MPRSRLLLIGSLISLLALPAAAAEEEGQEPLVPIVERGSATLQLGGDASTIDYSTTVLGPLVALQRLVPRLGGVLEIGPLEQSHRLTINEETFVFGPESSALTVGEEILDLSQPPALGAGGLHVPLDLLARVYGETLGYEFGWQAEARLLTVDRLPMRELPVITNLVHLQGVTTLVFQFPTRPRYRVRRSPGAVDIELVGDRLDLSAPAPLPEDALVRQVRFARRGIRVELSPRAVVEDYVLQRPFRLVFDIYRGTAPTAAAAPRAPAQPRQRGTEVRTIVIDPGHGGSDTGAVGDGGVTEKHMTLLVARQLKRLLEARLPVRVVLTREEDADLPLETRSALANQNKGDLFISLHLNSSPEAGAKGAETYFSSLEASDERAARAAAAENRAGGETGDPLFDLQLILWDLAQSHYLAESQRLAGLIQEELNLALELRNRGVKQAPFRVLMGVAMPAVLVELGFLSNPDEERRIQDPSFRAELAETLTRAIARYRARTSGVAASADEALR